MDNRFIFLGGDRRIIYAARSIAQRRSVSALGLSGEFPAPQGRYGGVILPLPATTDGSFINAPLSEQPLPLELVADYAAQGGLVLSGGTHPALIRLCEQHGLRLYNYFADEALTLRNAALTAEAAVALLIENTEFSLAGASVLITGGGRIALLLARLLRGFGADCVICARNPEQRTRAQLEYCRAADLSELTALCGAADIAVNTVPAALFGEEQFRRFGAGALFMELASKSPEAEQRLAEKYGVRHLMAGGLPGRLSPKTAGEAVAQAILYAPQAAPRVASER